MTFQRSMNLGLWLNCSCQYIGTLTSQTCSRTSTSRSSPLLKGMSRRGVFSAAHCHSAFATGMLASCSNSPMFTSRPSSRTRRTVSILTVTTRQTSRTMYCGSSARLGSLTMPLRLSSLTWYWSMTQSSAERYLRAFHARDARRNSRSVLDNL